jgi:Domain of unknown function (DUF4469) with IG-like fold
MAFYFREIPDPKNKGKVIIERIADDEADLDDIIYQMPGGIYMYKKFKLIYNTFGRLIKNIFVNNSAIKTGKGKFIPKPFQSQYDDELLSKIEKDNHKPEVEFFPNDVNNLDTKPIKVEGKYVPEAIKITKIIDHNAIPPMISISKESIDKQRKIENGMPFIKQIKQGSLIRIVGDHLKLRPSQTNEEGLFFLNKNDTEYELSYFLQINSTSVLLLAIPIDFPIGEYTIYIRSGWYADPSILREGISPFSIEIIS